MENCGKNGAGTEFSGTKIAGTPKFAGTPNSEKTELAVALTIAGSDSGGGAGTQADLLTFAALGVFGTTAISALTAQNPDGVSGVHAVPADFVRAQAEQIARFFKIRAAKTGMLANAEIIAAVADFFEKNPEIRLVADPVMIATSGAKLLAPDAVGALRERLLPRAALVTPNLDEAEVLLGEKIAWRGNANISRSEICATAERLAEILGVPALLKGGHALGDEISDVLAFPRAFGAQTQIFSHPRISGTDTHGSGCTLSAAIAAEIAKFAARADAISGVPASALAECVARAEAFLFAAIAEPICVSGRNFIAHLRNLSA